MQLLTYEEIREKALLQGISDNKVSIGMWASLKGYIKTRNQITRIYLKEITLTDL